MNREIQRLVQLVKTIKRDFESIKTDIAETSKLLAESERVLAEKNKDFLNLKKTYFFSFIFLHVLCMFKFKMNAYNNRLVKNKYIFLKIYSR